MALPDSMRRRIEDEAAKRGADPAKAIAEAERLHSDAQTEEKAGAESGAGKASADAEGDFPAPFKSQLLIGHLPFIRVRELRALWLGLTESLPDDDLTCGEFQRKHGGASVPSDPAAT